MRAKIACAHVCVGGPKGTRPESADHGSLKGMDGLVPCSSLRSWGLSLTHGGCSTKKVFSIVSSVTPHRDASFFRWNSCTARFSLANRLMYALIDLRGMPFFVYEITMLRGRG